MSLPSSERETSQVKGRPILISQGLSADRSLLARMGLFLTVRVVCEVKGSRAHAEEVWKIMKPQENRSTTSARCWPTRGEFV